MNRRRKLWLLRTAFSAVCGIVCLLLILLWVRSYFADDVFAWNTYSTVMGEFAV
jgi:hypothetical protein